MHSLPSTSPMTFMTSHWLAFWRRLSTMARFMCSFWANVRARATEPTSGETTTMSSAPDAELLGDSTSTKTGLPSRLSTGISKKPWICAGVQVHGQHAVSACGGDACWPRAWRRWGRGSWPCGPDGHSRSTGMTAVIRPAEARRQASIMMSSSIRLSLTGLQVD